MAGVSDLPFRQLCRSMGVGLAASEMLTSDSRLWDSRKSRTRMAGIREEDAPRVMQIAGSEPTVMADAAKACVEKGAQIIDINMGCPAKKVCQRAAGSALLRDVPLVASILTAVVGAVQVPVTLKMRTGWSLDTRNAVHIGELAEGLGIQAITLHGRSRACGYHAPVEYDTIARLVSRISIPVIANGDICTPQQARRVLDYTGAKAVMIGRAAHGRPWLLREMAHFLHHGECLPAATATEKKAIMLGHVKSMHAFYGDNHGVKMVRKHMAWYSQHLDLPSDWRSGFNRLLLAPEQIASLMQMIDTNEYLESLEVIAA